MSPSHNELSPEIREFIEKQPLFFVGTAGQESWVNISPKGLDSLRILSPQRIVWVNRGGAGNETAAHINEMPRMTLMFCAFAGEPRIVRVYGAARMLGPEDREWAETLAHFAGFEGARNIFDLEVAMVRTACGTTVPRLGA